MASNSIDSSVNPAESVTESTNSAAKLIDSAAKIVVLATESIGLLKESVDLLTKIIESGLELVGLATPPTGWTAPNPAKISSQCGKSCRTCHSRTARLACPGAGERLPREWRMEDGNPSKLIESLRYLGYDNYGAIADLVDNSWDAGAKTVKIWVRIRSGEPEIIIADNGTGMDEPVLNQAIKLGSMIDKDPSSDLGKFGIAG